MSSVNSYLRRLMKNKILVVLLLVAVLLFGSPFGMGVLSPGFEGAKCYFHGAYFPISSWTGYSGAGALHRYQDAETYLIQYKGSEGAATRTNTISWTSLATPNDAGMGYESRLKYAYGGTDQISCRPDLKIHVESNLQLQDINSQGDPLGWNTSEPMDARRIEYWSKKITKVSGYNDTLNHQTVVTYSYELTKESFLLTPVEFWVGYYMVPSQENNGGSGSGWREGEWKNIVVWFRLDFNVWDNAYKDPWLDDPKQNVFKGIFNGTILNQQKLSDYRGGFPISGWIQGWDKAGWTSSMSQEQDPVWASRRGENGDAYYTASQLGDLKNQLMSKVQFSPGMVGQFLSLYNAPDVNFQYKSDLTASSFSDPETLTADVKAPDSTMHKVMYFPMNIENFGTLVNDLGWWNWDVYYPEAYFRIRMIYGVYGTFKYLWTENVVKPWKVVDPITNQTTYPGGLDFPAKVETAGTTIIHTSATGAWTAPITDFFSSPLGLLWTFFISMVIVVIVVTVLNPGVWASLAMAYKSSKPRGGSKYRASRRR